MNSTYFPLMPQESKKLPFYLTTIGLKIPQMPIRRDNGFPDFQWLHCDDGAGILEIDGQRYEIKKGMGFIFSPNVPHTYYETQPPFITSWVTFQGYGVESLLKSQGIEKYKVFTISEPKYVDKMLFDISECIKEPSIKDFKKLVEKNGFWSIDAVADNHSISTVVSSMLYYFLITMKQFIGSNLAERNKLFKRFYPTISYIEKNYNKNITLSDLAKIMDLTESHYCRVFKELYGQSPFSYINKYRIHKAKEMIHRDHTKPIQLIAEECGFNNFSYFCTTFKKQEHISPSQFRNLYISYKKE